MIGTTDTDRSGQTFTRVAVKLGSGKVHYARKYDGWGVSPQCGGNRASERYYVTTADVDCKRCLKLLAAEEAAEQAHQDRVDASMQPATGEGDYLAPAAPVAEATPAVEKDPITGWPIFTVGSGRYAVGPVVPQLFGNVEFVKYFWVDGENGHRRAYADSATGTVQRLLWDARYDYDTARAAAQQPEAEPLKARQVSVDMQSETQGVAMVHGADGFQGLIGADGDGGFYAENPYANAMWHQDGFSSVTAAADGLARSDGFAGTVRITVTREYSTAVPVTSTTEAPAVDPSRVAGDAEEDALAAALSSAGIVFTPEQLSAAATTLTAQQPEANLAARVMAAIDLGDAEWMRCDNGPEAESTALRTIEAIRQLAAPGSKMRLPEPPAVTEVRLVMDTSEVGTVVLAGAEVNVGRYGRFSDRWVVLGYGITGSTADGVLTTLARRLGITGPVTTTVVPPRD